MFAAGKSVYASVGAAPVYVEDVFSPYLYDGNYTARTITNNIDLLNKGGLVWSKSRDAGGGSHFLTDTARGAGYYLITNATNGQAYSAATVGGFSTTGYTLGLDANINWYQKYISWTFRKQAKFFDVVTWTGNGSVRTIAHSLGSDPGCIIIKRTDTAGTDWVVGHRSLYSGLWAGFIALNLSIGQQFENGAFNSTAPTSSVFTVGTGNGTYCDVNTNGGTYVAYLFAHNAGGFGLSGSDDVITCGSYTGNGSTTGPVVTLGYEPQWLLIKSVTDATDWNVVDNMRGFWVGDTSTTSHSPRLLPNQSNVEQASGFVIPNATGFQLYGPNAAASAYNGSGSTYIYIAIRRGPMKVPTDATSVFSPVVSAATTGTKVTTNFPIDTQIVEYRTSPAGVVLDRLRGVSTNATASGQYLKTTTTDAETTVATASLGWDSTGFQINSGWSGASTVYYNFRRAPSFFDQVCYTGNGNAESALNHNLGVVPEMVIIKARSRVTDGDSTWSGWWVKVKGVGNTARVFGTAHPYPTGGSGLHTTGSGGAASFLMGGSRFTNTTFMPYYVTEAGGDIGLAGNMTGETYVAYLFATCPGVSKVGTYTGTGSPQTINCGFTAGARFVMLKCTSLNGTNWVLFDSVRGIVSGIDPFIYLNSTTGEQSTLDLVAPQSTGFGFGSESYYGEINQSGQNYIFLAIA